MGETNPRLLALLLEDLSQDLERWGMRATDLMATATIVQRQADEYVVRTQRLAAIAVDQAEALLQSVAAARVRIDMAGQRSIDAAVDGKTVHVAAKHHSEKAAQALAHWQAEFQFAKTWEARAMQRVAAAETALAQAQAALRNAEYELNSAIVAYNACRNYRDDKGRGRNCSGELARVRAAEQEVVVTRHWVLEAQAELAAAKAELSRAQARVNCTHQAVELTMEANALGSQALDYATDALNAIERSTEATASANRLVQDASANAIVARDESEMSFQSVQRATHHLDESHGYHRYALRAEEKAQGMRILARSELGVRVGHLYRLNRPDSGLIVSR